MGKLLVFVFVCTLFRAAFSQVQGNFALYLFVVFLFHFLFIFMKVADKKKKGIHDGFLAYFRSFFPVQLICWCNVKEQRKKKGTKRKEQKKGKRKN